MFMDFLGITTLLDYLYGHFYSQLFRVIFEVQGIEWNYVLRYAKI